MIKYWYLLVAVAESLDLIHLIKMDSALCAELLDSVTVRLIISMHPSVEIRVAGPSSALDNFSSSIIVLGYSLQADIITFTFTLERWSHFILCRWVTMHEIMMLERWCILSNESRKEARNFVHSIDFLQIFESTSSISNSGM